MPVGKGPRGPGLCACGGCRRTREHVALLVDKVEGKRARDGLLVDMRPGEEGRGGRGALLRQAGGSAALAKLAGLRDPSARWGAARRRWASCPSSGAARGMGQCRTLDCYTLACRGVPRYKNNFSFLKVIKNIVKQVVKHSSLETSLS